MCHNPSKKGFWFYSGLNILWNFVFFQGVALLLLLNVSLLFPSLLPSGHVFVLDSAEYIEEVYYYGSGPQEIDDDYLQEEWLRLATGTG
jgi:hypothetical protein